MEIIIGEKNKNLRQKSKPVENLNREIRDLIAKMREIMRKNNGAGLAAVQIGMPLRIIVCEINDKFYAFINPEIVNFSKETTIIEEGCLSLPGFYGEVERPKKITLKAITPEGKKTKIKVFGLLARIIHHELDHLEGILFTDKASGVKEEKTIRKMAI